MASTPPAITPSSAPTNKSVAATGGSAFGAAIATLALYFLGGNDLPPEVQGAITTIITAIITGAAAYLTPPGTNEAVLVAPDGGMQMARIAPQ